MLFENNAKLLRNIEAIAETLFMKILIANWVYNWGSTGFIVRDLVEKLREIGHDISVATAVLYGSDTRIKVFTSSKERLFYWRLGRVGLPRLWGSKTATNRLIAQIEDFKPDVVNLHLLHCHTVNFYSLLKYLGENSIKTVITNHAEIYYTGNCEHAYECHRWIECQCKGCHEIKRATGSYILGNPNLNWRLMKNAISYFIPKNLLFTAVSPWLKERFYLSPITKGFDCDVVLNGLNIENFYPRKSVSSIFDRIGTKLFVLHVTAYFCPQDKNSVKGSIFLVKLAEAMPELKFVVVSTIMEGVDSLPENIFLWGKAKDQNELAELYSAAKLSVLVSRRETFSMVTAESLCCGTPVVGFKAGGPESISIPGASHFVEQGDLERLAEAIRLMNSQVFDRIAISNEARIKYSPVTMANGYLDAFEKVLKF